MAKVEEKSSTRLPKEGLAIMAVKRNRGETHPCSSNS